MLTAPITLAVLLLATQQPVAPSADGATTSAQHDPEEAVANPTTIQMLTRGKVKFELLDSKGAEHKASLVRIDGSNAVLRSHGADYPIPVDQLRRIERPGDHAWDGALIGLGVGFGVMVLVASHAPLPAAEGLAAGFFPLLGVSAAIGYAIDAMHGGKHTLYVGTMPATPATHASALAVGLVGHAHDRGLQASYRLAF
jgi:hypothetical protein